MYLIAMVSAGTDIAREAWVNNALPEDNGLIWMPNLWSLDFILLTYLPYSLIPPILSSKFS